MINPHEFIIFLDDLSYLIDISLDMAKKNNSENLEIDILNYINEKYSSLVVPKGYILEIINNGYKLGTEKYKKNLEFVVADIKYKLNNENINMDIVVKDGIKKVNILFNSIVLGTNYYYIDYIENALSNVMKYLIDISSGSMSFAKNSIQIRNDIKKIITDYFKLTMNEYGTNLKKSLDKKFDLQTNNVHL